MILNIFHMFLRCLIHHYHKITCLPLKILAENMDLIRVQKCLQRTPFRTLIFINFFVCTAKIPSSQQGKLIYLGKNQKKQKKRPASQVFFFFLPAFGRCCPLVIDCSARHTASPCSAWYVSYDIATTKHGP